MDLALCFRFLHHTEKLRFYILPTGCLKDFCNNILEHIARLQVEDRIVGKVGFGELNMSGA